MVKSTTWGKTANGWVSMEYIKLTTSSGTATQPEASPKQTGKVTSDDVLRVRSGAGTSYGVVDFLNPGATVTVTETKEVNGTTWGKVGKGWVSLDYVELEPLKDEDGRPIYVITKTVCTSMLNVRSGPGTTYEICGYYYEGAKVEITEIKTVNEKAWGKTEKGWISMAYVE